MNCKKTGCKTKALKYIGYCARHYTEYLNKKYSANPVKIEKPRYWRTTL